MSNINKLDTKNSDDTFIDMNGKSWRKIRSKGYVVMGKDETLVSTATLLFDCQLYSLFFLNFFITQSFPPVPSTIAESCS